MSSQPLPERANLEQLKKQAKSLLQAARAADDEALSTAELVERVGVALGKPARLFYVPRAVVSAVASAVGQRGTATRLFGSLEVDSSHARRVLGWAPAMSIDAALAATAQHFLSTIPR